MRFCSTTLPSYFHPKLNIFTRRSIAAAQIATMSYLADVKANVRLHAESIIALGLASPDEELKASARARKGHLRRFLQGDNPLSYDVLVYPALIRTVNPVGSPVALQLGDSESLSTLELAALFYNMGKDINPIPMQAPLWLKAPCFGVFKVAISFIAAQASLAEVGDIPAFVKNIIALVFDEKEISHVPWSPPSPPNMVGRHRSKVVFNYFRSTAKALETGHRAIMKVVSAEEEAQLTDTHMAVAAAKQDSKAAWCINPLSIGEVPSILHKQTLPEDFSIAQASLAGAETFVVETYEWAARNYNGANPFHMFALLVAHIFSKIAPNLGHPPAPPELQHLKRGSPHIGMTVRASAWVPESKASRQKGLIAPLPFIVMVTTTIMAMADPTSPLRRYMKHPTYSQGSWSHKHSKQYDFTLKGSLC